MSEPYESSDVPKGIYREIPQARRPAKMVWALALVGGLLMGWAFAQLTQPAAERGPAPDWTVMPCSAYENGAHPDIPDYTRTDVCVTPDGRWEAPRK